MLVPSEIITVYAITLPPVLFWMVVQLQHNMRTWSGWILLCLALTLVWPLTVIVLLFESVNTEKS